MKRHVGQVRAESVFCGDRWARTSLCVMLEYRVMGKLHVNQYNLIGYERTFLIFSCFFEKKQFIKSKITPKTSGMIYKEIHWRLCGRSAGRGLSADCRR